MSTIDAVYICPTCDEVHYCLEDAVSCEAMHGCVEDAPLEFARCPVCKEARFDHESAVECCLWRSMPFADRLTLLDHVRFGRLDAAHAMLARH